MSSIKALFTLFLFCFASLIAKEPSHYVLVSVAPHKFFVEQIAGDTVNVGLMVPAGASAHTFEPTPKQMLAASQADAWFILGEHFENRAVKVLKGHSPRMQIVDLRDGIDMIIDPQHGGCCHGGADPHIWLSPKIARKQAQTIAREYGLMQLSIEFEGKDPKPQQLTKVIQQARAANIETVFIQPQYSSKGANLIAKELGASIVDLNPYSEDYINSLQAISKALAKSRTDQT